VLIILAFILLFLLPWPWNLVGFLIAIPLWFVELLGWNRTVKHRRKAVGAQTLIGTEGVVSAPCRPVGQIRLNGEIWEARCEAGASPGDRVRVVGRDGLTPIVEPLAVAASEGEQPVGAA
jgi:membrane protein implicated in regulation of membrane protease activity